MCSSECCGSNDSMDYNKFLLDVTWVNEDYPEANLALLEGIRAGMIGYKTDGIILSQAARRAKSQKKSKGEGESK